MSVLLIGRWDSNSLTITESHQTEDGDQDAIDRLVAAAIPATGANWACEYPVDNHAVAVQRAYEERVRAEDGELIDEAEGFTASTF